MRIRITTLLALLVTLAANASAQSYDVVVIGATPGGIGAALAAARLGHTVALTEYYDHVGGMSASGLGKSDITQADAIGGIWDEFVGRVLAYYTNKYGTNSAQVIKCKKGYFYEPSVAESIFLEMLHEQPNIKLLTHHRLDEVTRTGNRVSAVRVMDRHKKKSRELTAKIFIDATYEGDLAAYAGAPYRVGRESRDEFDEAHAGVIYMDHTTRSFLPGSTGLGDDRLVAYTYRLCLTTNPDNMVVPDKPADYDRTRYLHYLLDLKLGRIDSVVKALSIAEIPNQKYDVNMKPWPLGFPFAEENVGYPDGTWEQREAIMARIRNITLGLLYFLQNDPDVPEVDRTEARRYGLPKDEFTDNENFPWQFYVREARRLEGEYMLSERDLTLAPESGRAPVHYDAISAGEFPIDSFPTRKYEPGHEEALEGYILMLNRYTQPYQIPYRAMLPQKVEGLIVPVAASATHIAFSSVRLEPTWMSMGQAAGVAAHLAIENNIAPRKVSVTALQKILVDQKQVLTFFSDLPKEHPAFPAFQFMGTKGLFDTYLANPDAPLTNNDAAQWHRRIGSLVGTTVTPPFPGGTESVARDAWQQALAPIAQSAGITVESSSTNIVTRAEACEQLYKIVTNAKQSEIAP